MPDHRPTGPDAAAATPPAHAVVPVAGLATRFLPASKTVPKTLFPLVDRPALQYVVAEAAAAGIADVTVVVGPGQEHITDHFAPRPDLEEALAAKGATGRLAAVRETTALATVRVAEQTQPRGLGHAVGCAQAHADGGRIAVMLGDDLIDAGDPVLPQMLDIQARTGGIVLCLMEVPWEDVHAYGVASVEPADIGGGAEGGGGYDTVRVTGLVEKPPRDQAPSNLILVGRYVLPYDIFDAIRRTDPGRGGEIQLTDAMMLMVTAGTPAHGVVFRGRRYDTGTPLGYLQAGVQIAAGREDIGPEFRKWLGDWVVTSGLARTPARELGAPERQG